MKNTIIFLLSLFLSSQVIAQPVTRVSFYIISHQDQWQLFMGLNAYNDIVAGPQSKVVFIYVNAGDSSCGRIPLRRSFYKARQQGANNAVEFCADQNSPHEKNQSSYSTIHGHHILRHTYKNVNSYCLALPDGCNGTGLFGQSLKLSHDHSSLAISSVDSSARYSNWDDLMATINNIILSESTGIANISLNIADTNTTVNPRDNPDHIYAALLGIGAARAIPNVKEFAYQEYCTDTMPANLSDADLATKSALLSILDYGRTSNSQSSEWTPAQVIYAGRNYFREIR